MDTDEPSLGQICIQVQPARAVGLEGLDALALKNECEALARNTEGIRGFSSAEGDDDGPYVNLVFATERPIQSWRKLQSALLESAPFGGVLKASSICMCTGRDGWNDYKLLYHFDPTVPLDAANEA